MQETIEVLAGSARSPIRILGGLTAATLLAWWIYVPVHELLHALGCVLAGGSVSELRIGILYGGGILEKLIPFVRGGGEYAGQLSGFATGGSDLVHLATDFLPFVATLFGAVTLLRFARRSGSFVWFGAGFVLVAAPLISLPGDFYEIGSIVAGDLLEWVIGDVVGAGWDLLRTDDLFRLLADFPRRFPERRILWGTAVGLSAATGCLLATATLAASHMIADLVIPVETLFQARKSSGHRS